MDWSAFAPDRPPGSSSPAHGAIPSQASPTWSQHSPGSRQFSPGQLVGGLGNKHVSPSRPGRGPGTAHPTLQPSPKQLPGYPYSAQPTGYAAAPAASGRPRQHPPPPVSTGAAPMLAGPSSNDSYGAPPGAVPSSGRSSSRKGSLPVTPGAAAGSALPPLPLSSSPAQLSGAGSPLGAAAPVVSPRGPVAAMATPESAGRRPGLTPTSAASPSKRANPLEDLIATETVYVQDLGTVIKRVAAAWSRANFPPPALDGMFRAIEAVYRVNKGLLAKLLEIGPNPASPKALGDLLMRWVDDVEPAYTRYAQTYAVDYDAFEPVQSNPNLAPILASLEWPPSLPALARSASASGARDVTLDRLFELPLYRVQYYQRLYAKLLRSTQEGKSDHALLVSANEKLAGLEALCEQGKQRSVLPPRAPTPPPASEKAPDPTVDPAGDQEVLADKPANDEGALADGQGRARPPPPRLHLDMSNRPPTPPPASEERGDADESTGSDALRGNGDPRTSGDSANFDSPLSSESLRSSGATGISTANTSTIQSFSPMVGTEKPLQIDDLERRLNTDRTLDIFTMQPRRCKLQIQPPSLPFQRELRLASDIHLSFVPSSDPAQRLVTHPRAHIILLTDLFLVAERVASQDLTAANGADFWLLYPPLAGKHLRVAEAGPDALEITVMQRERLVLRFDSADAPSQVREWMAAVQAVVQHGSTQPPMASQGRQNSTTSAYGQAIKSPTSAHGHGYGYDSKPMPLPPRSPSTGMLGQPGSPGQSGRPQLQLQPLQPPYGLDPSRRAVSNPSSAVQRPARGASMNSSPSGGLVQSPSASSFMHASGGSSRGPSPSPNGYSDPADQGRFSMNSNRSRSPGQRQSSQSNSDFGELSQSGSSYYLRPDSRQSNGSYSSNRTDSFGRWPEAPPPLPKERTYNGMDISGRGGPLFQTSLRGGDNLHPPPGNGPGPSAAAMHRARSADALRSDALQQQQQRGGGLPDPQQHQHMPFRMPSQTLLSERAASAPNSSRSVASSGGGAGRLVREESFADVSPPSSPVKNSVPDKTAVIAQMRCKVFLQQHHATWKSLGTAKLRLFHSLPSNRKQLVVDSDKGGGKTIISTIVLEDGVERVGKTGVAVELSHEGDRTGIVHMLQLKTEQSAVGLFEQLLIGTDRARR